MQTSERLFLVVSPLPPLAWLAASAYLDRLEGWGAWAMGPMLLGPTLLASLGLGLSGAFLSLRARADRLALLRLGAATLLAGSVVLVFGAREIYAAASADDRFDPQPYREAAAQAEQRNQALRASVRLGSVTQQLSCRAEHPFIPAEYGAAYERARFVLPLEVTESGRYRVRVSYSSDLNDHRRDLNSEQLLDLAAGAHEIGFDYAFGRTWGYFVEAPASTLEVQVDRYASLRELYGEEAALVDQDIERKVFRNVVSQPVRLEGIANVFTDTVGSLVCPEQPAGPSPPQDGPR